MSTYSVSVGHSAQQNDAPDAAEVAEAPDAVGSWLDWLSEARDAIDEADGDSEDIDNLIAVVLEHVAGGGPDAVARKEERLEEILREAQASNGKITVFLHRQREARKTRAVESAALAERLDRMAGQIAAVTQENAELRATLTNCEQNLRQATDMLEKEIARERSLRRLLDAQRSRPHTQRIASELAKRHAAKTLEVVTKSKTEAA
jgi:hypothetical protein